VGKRVLVCPPFGVDNRKDFQSEMVGYLAIFGKNSPVGGSFLSVMMHWTLARPDCVPTPARGNEKGTYY